MERTSKCNPGLSEGTHTGHLEKDGREERTKAKVLRHVEAWAWVAGTKASLEEVSEEAIGGDVLEADRGQATWQGLGWLRWQCLGVVGVRSLEASLSTLDSGLGPGSICSHERALPNRGFY